jgi:hypothetical protein
MSHKTRTIVLEIEDWNGNKCSSTYLSNVLSNYFLQAATDYDYVIRSDLESTWQPLYGILNDHGEGGIAKSDVEARMTMYQIRNKILVSSGSEPGTEFNVYFHDALSKKRKRVL